MPKYRITGKNTPINQSGAEKKFGDEIDLSINQARELQNAIEPIDEAAKADYATFTDGAQVGDLSKFREHERESILKDRKKALEDQLKTINQQLSAATAEPQKPKQPAGQGE